MLKFTIILLIILTGHVNSLYPQSTFRSGVFLHHSTGGRVWDYSIYEPNYSGANIPEEMNVYNASRNLIGEDAVSMNEAWFPPSGTIGNEWYDWHMMFDKNSEFPDIYPYVINNKILVIKSCGPSSVMVTDTYGGPEDTTGSNINKKTIYNYKWHWRSIVKVMEQYPNNFFVIWTGTPARSEDITPLQALFSHYANSWLRDTLALGLDETYGFFPDNVYIWDWFHRIVDENYFLRPEYVTSPEDGHPNHLVSNLMAPLFVEEIFDAAIAYETVTGIKAGNNLEKAYCLDQNYPNPFNPITEISFVIAHSGNVSLKIYDSLGSEIVTLLNKHMEVGKHSIKFNAEELNSGVYFYRIEINNFTATRKMLLIK